jgi:hypothetical protein
MSNISDKLKKELSDLTEEAKNILNEKGRYGEILNKLLYQNWFTKALPIVRQLVPDRAEEFEDCYKLKKDRKEIWANTYTINDYMNDIYLERGNKDEIMRTRFYCQLGIIMGAFYRLESLLSDIKNILQAELFDSELEVAEHLLKNGHLRAAGAIAGVMLEGHLKTICKNHNIQILNNDSTISYLNEILKKEGVYDIVQWRRIQFLADIRNLCDHKKQKDPTIEDIEALIDGVNKVIKLIF